MFDSLFSTATTAESSISPKNLCIAIGVALVLGFVISLAYMKTQKNKIPSQSFSLTLVMLPAVVSVIILLVGSNVARALSLGGAFSIIRFRSAPGESKDIMYVLLTMAVGLACGMGYVGYAVIAAVILCIVMTVLELSGYGKPKSFEKILKITIPENLDYQNALSDIMDEYTSSNELLKLRTAELGSLYELQYSVVMKNDSTEKDFIDALRCRNGNLNITMVLAAKEKEVQVL